MIEARAANDRRKIENEIKRRFNLPEVFENSETRRADGYLIKMVGRKDQKINADKLMEIANEAGIAEHLSTLFRWKPEIISAKWKAAHSSIIETLSPAIQTKAGRPSFTIEKAE